MKTLSRRKVLLTLLAVPVATILPRISLSAPRAMTVNEAMRFLCDEVFPSPCQKRSQLHGLADHRRKREAA
ncbi:hypothetical protein A8H27_10800 [Burkholderia cenocepacia]|nr:hypothetical protein A8E82_18490 [Burkholderia cenocepacia]ONV49767.1 hypothetical protein A8E76_28530 [Burkholderia cenocepacia]ONW08995.1 hypothetical protein A8E86_03860 [Burkholderia cenocepacia]PNF08249.1 hypothetical protein A8H27_10800 [Burkholderia cenocepacia]RSC41151.1 hypothetical protein EGT44_30400 [Burkholderia cenocepacia]